MLRDALAHHQAGRLAEAETIYREILSAHPDLPDALHLLGMIEHQRGSHAAAVKLIRQAIAANPREAAFHSNLGTIFQSLGRLNEAAGCFERALALKPDWAEVHSNFGNILHVQGSLEQAAVCQERALELKPQFAEAWSNLGNVRVAQNRLQDAIACYERALVLKPRYADAHNNLGAALLAQDKIDDAVSHLKRALALRPNHASAHNNLGNAFVRQDRIGDAHAQYERALALHPGYANAHNNLANVFKAQGQFSDALAHYAQAIALQPDYAEAHLNRADVKPFHPGDPDLLALEALARDTVPSTDKALFLHFALAKAIDDVGDYARAFEHLRRGNALKRRQIDYREDSTLELFNRIRTVFDVTLFDRLGGTGDPSAAPVFVLGMPRSGSTLVEQILAGHPRIYAAGELTILEKMDAPGFPESVAALDAADLHHLAESYLGSLPRIAGTRARVIDKLPGNFLRIGLIRLMFPNARFIHTMRHPVDTCVSCYLKLFTSGLPFTYHLAELGRYYRAYRELMDHWRSVLPPGVMLDVSYEDVVDDLEGQARRLIAFCGLPWDQGCVSFHESGRTVKTASAVQVRQPLYRSSLQRWRRHEAYLSPLLEL